MKLNSKLRAALALDLPYFSGAMPILPSNTKGKPAAVLALLAERDSSTQILLTQRPEQMRDHKGQFAFPGGASEGESPEEAALRETEEEVGISPSHVQIVGRLPEIFTFSSAFWMTPVVGIFLHSDFLLRPNAAEISKAFWISLKELRASYQLRDFKGFPNHVFNIPQGEVWGATGAVLKNLLDRLETLS